MARLDEWLVTEQRLANATSGPAPANAPDRRSGLERLQAVLRGHAPAAPIGRILDFRLVEVEHGRAVFQGTPEFPTWIDAVFRAFWADNQNMGDPAAIAAVLRAAGLDADGCLARIESTAIKQALREATDAAVARGVFGAPSFFVGDAMFVGQDRLGFVERALEAR